MSEQHPTEPIESDESGHMTIGAVSRATGIPPDTLRTWERRYGFPTTLRTPSGHRLYSAETAERLHLIAEALRRDHRVSQIIGLEPRALRALLDAAQGEAPAPPAPPAPALPQSDAPSLQPWLDAVSALDESRLKSHMQHAWSRYGALRCLEEWLGPFMWAIGQAWEEGSLRVFHEHFASECVREFLASHWRALAEYNGGPLVVMTTLPGEEHSLGLHMAACVLALAGLQMLFLGANTPLEDIVSSAQDAGACAVVISISFGVHSVMVNRHLAQLRRLAPPALDLVVGGSGLDDTPGGVVRVEQMAELLTWAQARCAR